MQFIRLIFYVTTQIFLFFCLTPPPLLALSPEELVIVYNSDLAASKELADYYSEKRQIPAENSIGLSLPTAEKISRTDYQNLLATPLLKAVQSHRKNHNNTAILLVHGVPLKVTGISANTGSITTEMIDLKVAELATLAHNLAAQISLLIDPDRANVLPETPANNKNEVGKFLTEVEEIMRSGVVFIQSVGQDQKMAIKAPEINSLLVRLAGLSPIAQNILLQANGDDTIAPEQRLQSDTLFKLYAMLETQLARIPFQGVTNANIDEIAALIRLSKGVVGEMRFWLEQRDDEPASRSSASVDSELSLLLNEPFRKKDWLPNPFLKEYDQVPGIQIIRHNTLMVARIDGPQTDLLKKMIDDSIAVEDKGLAGTFYIDARGIAGKKDDTYGEYDQHLKGLADIVSKLTTLKVVFDDRPALFGPGDCPDAALYCGWYSLGKYIDAFDWQPGAVAFHIASSEATTLRNTWSRVWCKRMIEEGVAATIGPVQEPYLQSFPRPDLFFPLLLTGKLPLLEVYYRATPFLSWRQVLVGDPLYTPFKNHPALVPQSRQENQYNQ